MDLQILIGIGAGAMMLLSLGVVAYSLMGNSQNSEMQNLLRAGRTGGLGTPSEERERMQADTTGKEFERLKKAQRRQLKLKNKKVPLEEKFYQAGMFTPQDRREFQRLRILMPLITTPLLGFMLASTVGMEMGILGAVIGIFVGIQAPSSIMDRRIKWRGDEILYYLPLVIEQVSIGVSSSLDIGPCLQRIVQMADERDSHNVVTEMIRHVQYQVKSGSNLEEALVEVGTRSGHTELKHAFMALAQVAKHGGEISRQLQELADSVAGQRETKIEAKIKRLELEATGPVGLVFLGYIVILLIGFGIQIKGAFQ